MASQSRREVSPVIDQLFQEGWRFDFFQAVRLLEQLGESSPGAEAQPGARPVGYDNHPSREAARFRAMPAHSFPAGAIASVARNGAAAKRGEAAAADDGSQRPPAVTIGFLGLTGPQGVLPQHYTSMLIERIRAHDHALRDFFDLFNHRLASLFYRAWEKHRFPVGYERHKRSGRPPAPDLFTEGLYSLVGLGAEPLRGQMEVDDESVLLYAGCFSQTRRSAIGLERMLADYFGLPVEVEQFAPHRVRLNPEDRWNLPDRQNRQGRNSELGGGMVLGMRVWVVQSRFRIRLGPLNYEQFRKFWPTGEDLKPLCELVRFYAGPEFDFEVVPVLQAEETPWFRLNAPEPNAPRLGWNTWLRTTDDEHHRDQVAFVVKSIEI